MLMTTAMSVAHTGSAPGKADSAQSTPMARVAPTGAEKTALKIVASSGRGLAYEARAVPNEEPAAAGIRE